MGNFEKLGILVIIVLVVTILVLTFWGMKIPLPEPESGAVPAKTLSGQDVATRDADHPEARRGGDPLAPWVEGDGGGEQGGNAGTTLTPLPHPGGDGDDTVEPIDPPEPDPQPAFVTHVVKKGEKLWSIAARYYGSGARYPEILEANPGVTAQNLQVGTKLRIPDPTNGGGAAPAPRDHSTDAPPSGGRREITVRKGDNLWKIAARELGDGGRYREIYDLNRDRIGGDPTDLKAGMVLLLP